MKKLYISCPMRGRTIEEIERSRDKMHRIAEAVFDQDLELVDSFVSYVPPETNNIAIWQLGENIKKMAQADYFIGVSNWAYRGCNIEREVAESYGIKMHLINVDVIGIKDYGDMPSFYADHEKIPVEEK